MNFKEWYKKEGSSCGFIRNQPDMQFAWDSCKEQVLKIIFLNTEQNGRKHIDVDALVAEIEEL